MRRGFRYLLRNPEKVLVLLCTAFLGFSMLILFKSSERSTSDHDTFGRHNIGSIRRASLRAAGDRDAEEEGDADIVELESLGKKLEEQVEGNTGGRHKEPDVDKGMASRLEALERHLEKLDERLVASQTASPSNTPAISSTADPRATHLAANADPLLEKQMAMLSQQVAAVLSIVALEQQRTSPPSLPPPPPPPPPPPMPPPPPPAPIPPFSSWETQQKLDEIKNSVKREVSEATKQTVEEQLGKMKKTIETLSQQSNDRYAQVLKDLKYTTQAPPLNSTANYTVQNVSDTSAQAAGHGCRSPPCSRDLETCKHNGNCCIDRMYEMLVDFSEFLTSRNITHFVVAGTLLGGIRDKDIIPHTSDIDMVVPREGWEKVKEINHVRGKGRWYYFMQDPQEHHCARLCASWDGLPVNRRDFRGGFDWDTDRVGADIQYYMDIYDEDMDFASHLKHLHYPLSQVTIRNHTFPAPREQELWVDAKYGSGWRTPDHQSHGGTGSYPTLDEAKSYSEGVLTLRKARTDAVLGHRMLERAHVDHKSGQIVMEQSSLKVSAPGVQADHVKLQGFQVSPEGRVMNGTVVIFPPLEHEKEGEITQYVLYWAVEQIKDWDAKLEHLGKKLAEVSRCSTGGDPFKACSQRGLPLYYPLLDATVPEEATHLLVVAANEGGEAVEGQNVGLFDDRPGSEDAVYTRRVHLGLLQGFAEDKPGIANCVKGVVAPRAKQHVNTTTPQSQVGDVDADPETSTTVASTTASTAQRVYLSKDIIENRVVQVMIRKTKDDMRHALAELMKLLQPLLDMVQGCSEQKDTASNVGASLKRALARVSKPTSFNYIPGRALDIDNITIFLPINHAIGELRKDKPHWFGKTLGDLLRPLGVAPVTSTSTERINESSSDVNSSKLNKEASTKSAEKIDTSSLPAEKNASKPDSGVVLWKRGSSSAGESSGGGKVHIASSLVGIGAPPEEGS